MDMRLDTSCRHNATFRGNSFGPRPSLHPPRHVRHQIGIACLSDPNDTPVLDPDIRLDDAPIIENDSVRHDRIESAARTGGPSRLPHPVPQHLASAENGFIPVRREVFFNFDEQLCVCEPDTVAHSGTEEIRILFPWNLHEVLP